MKYKMLAALVALPLLATPALAQYGPPRDHGSLYMRTPGAEPEKSPYCNMKSQAWNDSWQEYYHCWKE